MRRMRRRAEAERKMKEQKKETKTIQTTQRCRHIAAAELLHLPSERAALGELGLASSRLAQHSGA